MMIAMLWSRPRIRFLCVTRDILCRCSAVGTSDDSMMAPVLGQTFVAESFCRT